MGWRNLARHQALSPLLTHKDATGCKWVSEKRSSRKPGEQARLPTPRYRIPMRPYGYGFPRMRILGSPGLCALRHLLPWGTYMSLKQWYVVFVTWRRDRRVRA